MAIAKSNLSLDPVQACGVLNYRAWDDIPPHASRFDVYLLNEASKVSLFVDPRINTAKFRSLNAAMRPCLYSLRVGLREITVGHTTMGLRDRESAFDPCAVPSRVASHAVLAASQLSEARLVNPDR